MEMIKYIWCFEDKCGIISSFDGEIKNNYLWISAD